MLATRRSLLAHPAARVLAVPLVAAVVCAGIWVTGGLLTNDFAVAMWLTAGWMALAGLACLAIAIRVRPLRVPVLGAYLVTAGAVTAVLGSSMLFPSEVDEQVAVAAPAPAPAADDDAAPAPVPAEPRNVERRAGDLVAVRHAAEGRARVIELARGGRVLTLTDFAVDAGPDLRVYLVAGAPTDEDGVRDYVDLGALKGSRGDQQYVIEDGVDVGHYSTVVIWCRAFSVMFAHAQLEPTAV
jgi:hypothetical protein